MTAKRQNEIDTATCDGCGEVGQGWIQPWTCPKRGRLLPFMCLTCIAAQDAEEEAAAELEAEEEQRREDLAAMTEEERYWDAREMSGEW